MGDVLRPDFSGIHKAQEPGGTPEPDIKRPPGPARDRPSKDEDLAGPDGPAAPPFTGEDVEDVGDNPPPGEEEPPAVN